MCNLKKAFQKGVSCFHLHENKILTCTYISTVNGVHKLTTVIDGDEYTLDSADDKLFGTKQLAHDSIKKQTQTTIASHEAQIRSRKQNIDSRNKNISTYEKLIDDLKGLLND